MDNLVVQLSEIELLDSMFTPSEFTYDRDAYNSVRDFCEGNGDIAYITKLPQLSFVVTIYVEFESKKTKGRLNGLFPHNYPSEFPQLKLHSDSFTATSLKELSQGLQDIIESMKGETCMISCILWLQEQAPKHFEIFLKPVQVLSSITSAPESNECSICLTDFEDDLSELVTVNQCKHKFCKECLSNYITFKTNDMKALAHRVKFVTREKNFILTIEDTTAYGIPCPARNCKHVMLAEEIVPLATPSAIENFKKFSDLHKENVPFVEAQRRELERRLEREAEAKIHVCPKWGCGSEVFIPTKRGRLKCSVCKVPVCKKCYRNHSPSMTCLDFSNGIFPHRKINGLVQCPHCTAFIERIDGCNYMTCTCTQSFCYLCGTPIDGSKHFSHFLNDPFGNVCKGPKDASNVISK